MFLEESGYLSVTTALSAHDALILLEVQKFDAVISDYQMPDMDGIQFLLEVRKHFGPVPFILFTGKGREEVVIQAINSGVDFYLQKEGEPLSQYAELVHKIRIAVERRTSEEVFHESENRYRSLVENMHDCVAVYRAVADGEDFEFLKFNKAAERSEGLSRSEVIGRTVIEVFPGIAEFGLLDVFRRVWCTGMPESSPVSFYKDNRISGWRENFVYKLPSGEIVAIYSDVTARKQAEEEINFKNLLLTTQQETSLDGILIVGENGKILSYNRQFIGLWGIHDDVVATGSDELALKSILEKLTNPDAFLEKVSYLYLNKIEKSHEEILLKDERVLDRYSAPMFGDRGKYYGRVWYFRDITTRKRAEEAIRASRDHLIRSESDLRTHKIELEMQAEELIRAKLTAEESRDKYLDLYEFAPLGYFTLSDKGLILEVNLIGASLLGVERSKLVNARFSTFVSENDSDQWYQYFVKIRKHGEKQTCTLMIQQGDGSMFPARLESIWITDSSGVSRIRVAISDISDIRKVEVALLKNADELQAANEQLAASEEELKAQFEALAENERIIRSSEERLVMAQEIGRTGSWEYNIATDKFWGSAGMLRIFGFNPVAGDLPFDEIEVFIPERERVHQALFDLIREGREYNLEYSINPIDGSAPKVIHSIARTEKDIQGNPARVVGVIHEITERKLAEDKLRHVTRLYALHSQIDQAIVRTLEQDELFRTICQIAIEFGQFRMAWIGLIDDADEKIKPVAHAGHEDGYLDKILITTGEIPTGKGPTGSAFREGVVVTSDDIATEPRMLPWRDEALKRGYRSSAAVPLRRMGKTIGTLNLYATEPGFFTADERDLVQKIGEDISFALDAMTSETERKRVEEALHESELHYRELANSITDLFFAFDNDLRYTHWNKASENLTGIKSRDAIGRSISDLFTDTPEIRKATEIYLEPEQQKMITTTFYLTLKRNIKTHINQVQQRLFCILTP
jgi:PAS domain S-box-containing protein